MTELDRISYPMSESWVAWVLLSLLLAILIANQRQSGLIKGAWMAMIRSKERHYHEMGGDLFQWILIAYFSAGVPSLLLYAFFFRSAPCQVWQWLLVLLMWLAMDGLRILLTMVIRYIFDLEKLLANVMQFYSDMRLLTGLVLYPVTALVCYLGATTWMAVVLYGLILILFGIQLNRMIRTMLVAPQSVLYIMLYFLTLEVVPLGIICEVIKIIV